ncbi:MAG: LPS-assembly protein LptD [Saprospiraceae bacterium]|nr:LPS-assembly protein LptD [Saprospiraceae bacterium]
MKIKFYIVFILLICKLHHVIGQSGSDTIRLIQGHVDTIILPSSLMGTSKDSTPWAKHYAQKNESDTLNVPVLTYKISKDSLDDVVNYEAKDSSWTDLVNDKIHLYGDAVVEYQKIKLTAAYMVIDFANNVIEGFEKKDGTTKKDKKPTFSDGEKTFTYKEIKYNFKSKKGLVKHALTKEGEFNLVGSTTKYISGSTDSLGVKEDDRIYNKDAIITTCTHDPPHYGIRANKLKFVPNKLAVLSVAQIEIGSVPTPIFLPFGFFPLAKGKSSGLIFPSSYEYNEQLGLGFREIGYYYPINDYVDLRVTGDIYTRGSHGVRVNTTYRKRYGYTGNVALGYSNNLRDNDNDVSGGKLSQKSFSINIRHNQDAKAHPYRRIGGSINIQTNRYDQRTYENPVATFQNTYSSNFSYAHDMPGTPFQFNAEFRHSQNTQTRTMDITFPNMTLRMNTIHPFKQKNSTKEKWTDNIAVSYSSEFRNYVKTTDTTLFTQQTLDNMQTGLSHKAGLSTNFNLFKYFNVSPNASYDEFWFLKRYHRTFDPTKVKIDSTTQDTLGFEAPTESFESGFTAYRNLTTGVSINTQIFGTKKWSKGFIRGIRHVMKPNISFNYKPENKERYEEVVDTDTRSDFNRPQTYSIFQNGPFGSLQGSEEQMALSYGITNVFEAKYWSKKDTTEKIVKLFNNIDINGRYNFAADSFRWSPVNISGNTVVLQGLTNFYFRALYSPYVYDDNNKITKQTVWDARKRPLEFRSFSGQFSTSVTVRQIINILIGKKSPEPQNKAFTQNLNPVLNPTGTTNDIAEQNSDEEEEKEKVKEISIATWFENFNISHALNYEISKKNGKDTFFVSSHSINITGNVPLTKNWSMNVGNIAYDFKNKSFVYPYFSFARDLHCWQMNFTWAPTNGVYSFFIGVKSTALSFLKYDYGQRNANTLFTGQR